MLRLPIAIAGGSESSLVPPGNRVRSPSEMPSDIPECLARQPRPRTEFGRFGVCCGAVLAKGLGREERERQSVQPEAMFPKTTPPLHEESEGSEDRHDLVFDMLA